MKHYKEQLSYFVNQELPADERQQVAEHLLQCAACRAEHDEIKLGAQLAGNLQWTDAPASVWEKIENSLDQEPKKAPIFGGFAYFNLRAAASCTFLLLGLLGIYFGVFRGGDDGATETARRETPTENAKTAPTPTVLAPDEVLTTAQNSNRTTETETPRIDVPKINPTTTNQTTDLKNPVLPKTVPVAPKNALPNVKNVLPAAWNVETLAGMPRINNSLNGEKLSVGEFLETDANSRARVQVADIGTVEIAPNSRVQLVGSKTTEHRLALERGTLKAQILAPPRLFIVDTPSAVAVDLGCEYTLEVDAAGNTRLHVTSGFVALENGKHEAIVPAGAIALTRKGKGVGTPFAEDSSVALQTALYRFDFENGGRTALDAVINESNLYDSITLWHLLRRTDAAARGRVFDALARHVEPPAEVTREGILRLDRKMLDAWWTEIENVWFG